MTKPSKIESAPEDDGTGPRMMYGTSGNRDYLLLGRKGNIALGFKLNAVVRGSSKGVPDTTWFGGRLRAAPEPELLNGVGQKVVAFTKDPATPGEVLPHVVWEVSDAKRSGTEVGIFVKGTPDGSEDSVAAFQAGVGDGVLSKGFASYLTILIGEEDMLLSEAEIVAFLEKQLAPIFKMIDKAVATQKAINEEQKSTIGQFGIQAALLKKVFSKLEAEPAAKIGKGKKPKKGKKLSAEEEASMLEQENAEGDEDFDDDGIDGDEY